MGDESTPRVVVLVYGHPGETTQQVSVTVTAELAVVFARAATVNSQDDFPLSFTSLLVGMHAAHDGWLGQYFAEKKIVSVPRTACC